MNKTIKGDNGNSILVFNKTKKCITKVIKCNINPVFLNFILNEFKHKNIIDIIDINVELYDNIVKQTFELCENGDLYNNLYIKKTSTKKLMNYYCGILDGVEYMHSMNVIHNDLKPENICITKGGIPKIIDIDYYNYLYEPWNYQLHMTIEYIPTELLSCTFPNYTDIDKIQINMSLDKKNDIWALGIIMYEILFRELPWDIAHINNIAFNKYNNYNKLQSELNLSKRFDDYQLSFINLIKNCLDLDYYNRYDIYLLKKTFNRELNTINAFYSIN
jgi:serine/threonine protein kinase